LVRAVKLLLRLLWKHLCRCYSQVQTLVTPHHHHQQQQQELLVGALPQPPDCRQLSHPIWALPAAAAAAAAHPAFPLGLFCRQQQQQQVVLLLCGVLVRLPAYCGA
jgi:hypothetical protein